MRGWIAAGALVALLASHIYAYRIGVSREADRVAAQVAEVQRAQMRAAQVASEKEAARLEAQAAFDDLSRQLEDAAYAQPVSDMCALPVERVLRLGQR